MTKSNLRKVLLGRNLGTQGGGACLIGIVAARHWTISKANDSGFGKLQVSEKSLLQVN
jgi:hypothetical protein